MQGYRTKAQTSCHRVLPGARQLVRDRREIARDEEGDPPGATSNFQDDFVGRIVENTHDEPP
jgi:hypothetical protein